MKEKLNQKFIQAYMAVQNFRNNEEGDTNFVSIMLVLGVVIGVAVVFSALSEEVGAKIGDVVRNFLDTLG